MKNSFKITLLLILGTFFYTNAQVRIGGGVSVNIDLPLPEVVIVNKKRTPENKRRPRPVPQPVPTPVPQPIPTPQRRTVYNGLGTINNSNTPDGNFVFTVINASIQQERQNTERVFYKLGNGETLELIIQTVNTNDYNYHYMNNRSYNRGNAYNNTILAVLLNGQDIPLRDGSISIQPQGYQGIHSVINLHSVYDGNFNGTVNF